VAEQVIQELVGRGVSREDGDNAATG